MITIILLFLYYGLFITDNPDSNNYINSLERYQMNDSTSSRLIIDSDYTIGDALKEIDAPPDIMNNLKLIDVQYYSFDGKLHQGQLVIHKDLTNDLISIFKIIREERFPVAKVIPIVHYNWNDEISMEDNNTSAFNYRFIAGTKKLSNHSTGTAIDINPLLNPYIRKDLHQPVGSVYNPERTGTITRDGFLVREFKRLGWEWGGDWKDRKDYQHFEKPVK